MPRQSLRMVNSISNLIKLNGDFKAFVCCPEIRFNDLVIEGAPVLILSHNFSCITPFKQVGKFFLKLIFNDRIWVLASSGEAPAVSLIGFLQLCKDSECLSSCVTLNSVPYPKPGGSDLPFGLESFFWVRNSWQTI